MAKRQRKTKQQLLRELGIEVPKSKKPRVSRKKLINAVDHLSKTQPLTLGEVVESFPLVQAHILASLKARTESKLLSVTDEQMGALKTILCCYNLRHAMRLYQNSMTYGHVMEAIEAAMDGKLLASEEVTV